MATPGKDTAEPGTNGVQSVTSCWGETNSRFLPLGKIGFAPLNTGGTSVWSCAECAHRVDE